MRCPFVCLLLTVALVSPPCLEEARAQSAKEKSAKEKSAPVIPHYDPPDQPFRIAPMPQSTRSIVVPLGTNLHLAFDTALLRTHTVWSGKGLALLGPQYGLPKSPFISTNDGTVLWTMPPVFPWAVGKLPENDAFTLPPGWRLGEVGGIPGGLPAAVRETTKFESHGPGLLVTYSKPHPTEPNASMGVHEHLKRGSFSANATVRSIHVFGLDEVAWFLAHAEMGKASLLTKAPNTALIERTNGGVLVMLQAQRTVDGDSVVRLVAVDRQVDYEVETVTEQGAEKGHPRHRVAGQQGRAYVQVENPGRKMVHFVVRTEVFPDRASALRSLAPENAPDRNASKFMLRMGVGPRLVAQVALPNVAQSKQSLAGNPSYRAEAFPLPPESNMQITGMTFLLDGDLAVCTWAGDVWVIRGAQGDPRGMKYVRLVRGLCEPMGILSSLREVYVGTKQGLYHIGSLERDEPPDRIRCVDQGWGYSGSYNAFVYGPVLDKSDNFILASAGHSGRWDSRYMGWAFSISKYPRREEQGNITPICSGLREPNGIGTFGPDRDVFVSENQGQWMAACKLNHVTPGKFYGHPSAWPAPQEEYGKHTRFDPPAVWFPYKLARSVTGFAEITDDRFGPFKSQLMVGDFQNAIVTRVQLEKVNGEYQGAVWPFLKQFQSGLNRLAYGPDGKLYVGGCQAPVSWKAVAPLDFALERISYTGKLPFEVKEVHAQRDGFELTFTQPVEEKAAANPDSYDVTQYGFKYHAKYGSPEFDHDGKENAATVIKVAGATVSPDKLKVRLKLEGWKTGYVTMVRSLDVKNAAGEGLVNDTFWYTLNQLPK